MKSTESKINKIKISTLVFFAVVAYVPVHFEVSHILVRSITSMNLIGIMFSIIIASLLVIISIISDLSFLLNYEEDWRVLWDKSKSHLSPSFLLVIVFLGYLIVPCLMVVVNFINEKEAVQFYWLNDVFIYLVVFGVLVAFVLPFGIINIQKKRLSERIRQLRLKDNS